MKILIISTNIFKLPPNSYSGLEMIAYHQAVGMAALGHQVLVVAPKGSKVPNCELHETLLGEPEHVSWVNYRERAKDYDVIIDHSWSKWSYISKMNGDFTMPVLGVCHAPINTMYQSPPPVEKPCLVAISKDQALSIKEHLKCHAEVAYNGVDPNFYKPTNQQRNNRYLFLARFSTIKGPDLFAQIISRCGVKGDMVGDDKITNEPDLLKNVYKNCSLYPGLRFVGPQSRLQCVEWFNRNKCLLHPNMRFREPFGLSLVEAQLCGMPVVVWDNGACRELVKNGETGFIVKSVEEIERLINFDALSEINSVNCREWAMQFGISQMCKRYVELCEKALGEGW